MEKLNKRASLTIFAFLVLLLSLSLNLIQKDFGNKFEILKLWKGLINGSICFASVLKSKLLDINGGNEIIYKKLPKLRSKFDIRNKTKVNNWNDIGVGIQSTWPIVPIESALFEFLIDYYEGIGKTVEDLMKDLLNIKRTDNSNRFISTRLASELVSDNLTVKFMETLIINRWYSTKVESLRILERSQKKLFNVNCIELNEDNFSGWILIIYKGMTFEFYCDLKEALEDISNGRNYGSKNIKDYDINLLRIKFDEEHIIGERYIDKLINFDIIAYIDFSSKNSYSFINDLMNLWEKIKKMTFFRDSNRIIIRYCDKNEIGKTFEYLTGYGVFIKRKDESLELDELVPISKSEISVKYDGDIQKTHKDNEYEEFLSVCDKAVNMENVIDIDGKLTLDCMKDVGMNIISISKRFEDPLGSILHYLENFGSYQLALCNSVRVNNTSIYYKELNERISQGSTILSINGRLFSPKDINFFNIVPILKRLIFGRIRLLKNNIERNLLIDSLSINSIYEDENLNLFVENKNGTSNDLKNNELRQVIIKEEMFKNIEKGELFDAELISDFEKELEQDPTILDELDWIGRKEYILSSSTPWTRSSPRTDWRVTQSLPVKIRSFYRDITNIGDSQWADTPALHEKVWFHKNLNNDTIDEGEIQKKVEFSPWIMYRVYFANQLKNAKMVEDYNLYDIMMEPENTLGQYLYPLESLPELFEKYPDNPGIYPVRATLLNIIVLCDPLDIECITIIIEIINKKLPIKLNLLFIDPEWVNNRKPNYSMSFIYGNVTTEEDFQKKFGNEYEINRKERLKENKCEQYYGKEQSHNCPIWLRNITAVEKEKLRFEKNSKGSYVLKLAISEIFGFLVSSSTIQGMFLARAFLEMIAKNLPLLLEPTFSLKQFEEFLEKFFTHFKIKAELGKVWEVIYSNNPNDSSYVNKATSYCRLKGFTSPGALINGYYVDINDLSVDEVIYGIASKEQRIIMEGVKSNKINNNDQIFEYIFNETSFINSVPVIFPPFTKSVKLQDWPYYGIKKEWQYIQKEISYKLHKKYDIKNSSNTFDEYMINLNDSDKRRVLFNVDDLSKLNYSILWDDNPEVKKKKEILENKADKTPWMTFVILVRSNKPGLIGLITIFDYWISTLSMQVSLNINKYNDLLFNRRFSILFISENLSNFNENKDNFDISNILQTCILNIFGDNYNNKGKERVPIIDKIRFAKWFIKLVIDTIDISNEDNNINQKIEEIYRTLSKSMSFELNNNIFYFKNESLVNETIKKKFLEKFSSKDEDVYSFPYSSISNGKLKGYPIHVNYNLSEDKNRTNSEKTQYGKASFKPSSISDVDCYKTFTLGIALNGVYLRVCPNTYPIYIGDDTKVNKYSPIHAVHLKLMELAVTIKMKQLALLGEYRLTNKKEDQLYRNKWSKLDPNSLFVLLNEHLYVSNQFKMPSLLLLEDIYRSSHSSIKLHLPTIKNNKNSLINVIAVVNPITNNSISILRLLNILHQILEADVKIIYNPIIDYQKITEIVLIDTWRRYVFNYPKLIQYEEDVNKSLDRFKLKDLKEFLYSSPCSTEFFQGNDMLYYLNSQFFANFDIQTNNYLELRLEQTHSWLTNYQNTVMEEEIIKEKNILFPSKIYNSGQILFIYKLVGVVFETILIDIQNPNLSNITEVEVLNINNNYEIDRQSYYSLSEFKSFVSYLGIGKNKMEIKYSNENSSISSNFQLQLFNPSIFSKDNIIISLTKLLETSNKTIRISNEKKGLLRTLHILCVSSKRKEMNEYVIEELIRIIDNGFLSGNMYYNKFIIYFDNEYVNNIIKEYYNFKLYWKYYIQIRYINIMLPKWIPKLSIDIENSLLNTILTLDHWISPQIEKLLLIDPFKIYVKKNVEEILQINNSNSTFSFSKLEQEYLVDKDLKLYSNFTTNIGLINMNKYKDSRYWLIKSYFELYNYFQYSSKSELIGAMIIDIFFSYLSKYIDIKVINKGIVNCFNKKNKVNDFENIISLCYYDQFGSEEIKQLKKLILMKK